MADTIEQRAMAQLFTEARTHNSWQSKPVSDEKLM
jgi:3-hydroxypropanoate dehydrogenase